MASRPTGRCSPSRPDPTPQVSTQFSHATRRATYTRRYIPYVKYWQHLSFSQSAHNSNRYALLRKAKENLAPILCDLLTLSSHWTDVRIPFCFPFLMWRRVLCVPCYPPPLMGCNVSADFDGCNEAEWGTLQKKSLTLGSQLNFQKKGSRKKIAKINAAFRRERGTFKLRKFWRSVNLSERLDLR